MITKSTRISKSAARIRTAPSPRPYSILNIEEEHLAPAVTEVGAAIEDDRQGSLKSMYRVGLVVDEHYRRLVRQSDDNNWEERGERYFTQLGEALNVSAAWLRDHYRLVRTYRPEEFEELCQTPGMTATKALRLAGIDGELRDELVERMADEGLSVREIDVAIKEAIGPRRKAGAGRPPQRPKKLKDAFVHLTTQADKFVRINSTVWFGDDYDIVDEINSLPMDLVTDDLKKKITEAAEKCEHLAAAAAKDAEALRSTLPEIDRRMTAQAECEELRDRALENEQYEGGTAA